MSNNVDSVAIEENLGLTGSETVGVIIAIVSGATLLIILVLLASMGCRFLYHRHSSGSLRSRHLFSGSRQANGYAGHHNIHNIVRLSSVEVEPKDHFKLQNEVVTTNTFQLPGPPPVDDSTFTNQQNGVPKQPAVEDSTPELELQQPSHVAPQQFQRDDLMLQDKLGEGEYGPIYRGEAYGLGPQGESQSVIIKMLTQNNSNTENAMFHEDIEMLSSISHVNVVGLLAVCTKSPPECLLLDAGMPGDLLSYIQDKRKSVAPHIATEAETKELLRIADDISLGMAYLASERFIHKDLALRNCIITFDGIVKIAHFGLGPLIYPEAYYRVSNTDLPIRWMSPEAITSANFTTMSDIWSFGVAVWELFTYGDLPFQDKTDNNVIQFVLNEGRLGKPVKCSNNVFEIILTCWNEDPRLRPSFYDLHETIADLAGIQSPLSALGPATPVSPLSPMTPTGFGINSEMPTTFASNKI